MKSNNGSSRKHTIVFYALLVSELLRLPYLWGREALNKRSIRTEPPPLRRKPVETDRVYVGIHEWGGYPMRREKTIKNGATFVCGLESQLERFARYRDAGRVELTVTLSDPDKHTDIGKIRSGADHLIATPNAGMDFSGYEAFYKTVENCPNAYVILSNSSVNAAQDDFLEGYIGYMEQHPEVGMLGISYCTKMIQSLVRNNFTPHLQSFFILTTIDVLRQIVAKNKGQFPGTGIGHKLLLIRRGEIGLSQLALQIGYRLAVVRPENGQPFVFTDYRHWYIPRGDIRQYVAQPNKITPVAR